MGFAAAAFTAFKFIAPALSVASSLGLFGGKKKPSAAVPAAAAKPAGPSPTEVAQKEDEDRRKRILALNQKGQTGQLTPAGGVQGEGTTTRKQLLGL